jgi:hypothetical protein
LNPIKQALDAEAQAEAEIIAIDAKIAKLETFASSACGAVADLAAIHNDNAARFAAWSANAEGTPPKVDVKHEAKLKDEIAAHASTVASANSAIASYQTERRKLTDIVASAGKFATLNASVEMVDAFAIGVVAEINKHGADLVASIGKLESLKEFGLQMAREYDSQDMFRAVERLHVYEKANITRPQQHVDTTPFHASLAEILNRTQEAA